MPSPLALPHALVSAVSQYVAQEEPRLPVIYTWKFEDAPLLNHLRLQATGGNTYTRNLDLKRQLNQEWKANPAQHDAIGDYYVRVWGGIKGNLPGTVPGYVQAIASGNVPDFKGIASWSKVAAAADAEEAAIFDARVAVSLNALQVMSGSTSGLAFPVLPSQNTLIKHMGPHLKKVGHAKGWNVVADKDVYTTYMALLRQAAAGLPGPLALARAEMVLFAMAEDLAGRAGNLAGHPLPAPKARRRGANASSA